ncbi:MAG: radical SAM protein [Candidatus Omnitrophota bacterium]
METLKRIKNCLLAYLGRLEITSVTLALTTACNLKCRMCDIWERNGECSDELSSDAVTRVLKHPSLEKTRHITFTGGEPFLRKDLSSLYSHARSLFPKSTLLISSNGTLTGEIGDFLTGIKIDRRLVLELSIHGLQSHDRLTRTPGALRQTQHSIALIQQKFPWAGLQAKFVITPWNYDDIERAAAYFRQKRMRFVFKIVENNKSYTNALHFEENSKNGTFVFSPEQKRAIRQALRSVRRNPLGNGLVTQRLIRYLETGRVDGRCFVPARSLFVNADGEAYRCRNFPPAGDVHKDDLDAGSFPGTGFRRQGRCDEKICASCVSLLRLLD